MILINFRCRAELSSPLRLQKAHLPGTRTAARCKRSGAEWGLSWTRPNEGCRQTSARRGLSPCYWRVSTRRAAGLLRIGLLFGSLGSGLGFRHLCPGGGALPESLLYRGVVARPRGAVCGCWPEEQAGLLQLSAPSGFGRRSRALFCFSVSFCVGLPLPGPCDPAELPCAPSSSAQACVSAAARSISEAVCICGT